MGTVNKRIYVTRTLSPGNKGKTMTRVSSSNDVHDLHLQRAFGRLVLSLGEREGMQTGHPLLQSLPLSVAEVSELVLAGQCVVQQSL